MKSKAKTKGQNEVCPKCEGRGYVDTDTGVVPCECLVEQQLQAKYRAARIPPRFLNKSLDNFQAVTAEHKHIVTFAKQFLKTFRSVAPDQPAKGLLLMGREGCGKTHIAVAILREIIRKGYSGLYWNVPELFLELRRTMNEQSDETEADLFDEAREVDLLVLDDLGAEKTSEYVTDRLYVLINGRYEYDKATLVTTNRSLKELQQQVGPRIVSRLCEMCVPIEFPPEDYRMRHLR
ncbi:MAG: AAA family ATPase [Candidatus Hydrogenedentota bacterium]|nr:ATP-binding protein [Candidatus Sumerlaea chitinivorans]RMH26014.1 MAG: AAA family ATPase [Candidatus Hydrogenedentota bacterium]GIX45634.1 MAG: IstB-like ATP-binding protein [Candidatus Sumerlaea sp.]